ncbi:F-box/kelch-repeat protein At3g23880-like [Vicia villosa]|uniref:F-box/kelch-repeat protein At3g23880-like n=1 Tax=Vicia villosa TaxID=3911 RepID=UPI00273C866F|nr:F-box/kelch-repeat protein At3g23880-like [Vicia villosa]
MASSPKRTNPKPNPNITDSLHTLPFELKIEILSRLPVKLLLQLTCICKSLNSIIFNPKFVRKHLSISTTRRLHLSSYQNEFNLKSYSLQSMFTDLTTNFTQLGFPFYTDVINSYYIACSCDGVLCLADHYEHKVVLWNPCIRKFKKLPPFENPSVFKKLRVTHGFGYDHVSDLYKVVVVYTTSIKARSGVHEDTTSIKVLTLGTRDWRTIPTFPFGSIFDYGAGKCVSGTVNWLDYTEIYWIGRPKPIIVSFDLAKESFQKISLPDHGRRDECNMTLFVWRDCLSIIFDHDVWVMNTYGVKESWIKLFSVSCLRNPSMSSILIAKASYICDGQLLLELKEKKKRKLIVYDAKNGTFKVTKFLRLPEVCVESLLSPDIV